MNNYPDFCYIRSSDYPAGAILPRTQVRISPDDRGFYFADGVYEAVRTYAGKLFRMTEHLQRFQRSLQAVRINLPDRHNLKQICTELLQRNDLKENDAFFYIQATRGTAPRNLLFPAPPTLPTLYVSVTPITPPVREQSTGIRVITVPDIRWQRCDIKSIGLLASVLARQSAADAGAEEALFVRNGLITEGTHTNLFGVKDGIILTHPLNNHILPGVTRIVLLELCQRLKLPVQETAISADSVYELDELFVTSTTWEVVPVIAVNNRPIGNGQPGPLTRHLQAKFREHCLATIEH